MGGKIERTIKEIVAESCNNNCDRLYPKINAKDISNYHNLRYDLPVDSLTLGEIIASIEDHFDLEIQSDNYSSMTVNGLIEAVKTYY